MKKEPNFTFQELPKWSSATVSALFSALYMPKLNFGPGGGEGKEQLFSIVLSIKKIVKKVPTDPEISSQK